MRRPHPPNRTYRVRMRHNQRELKWIWATGARLRDRASVPPGGRGRQDGERAGQSPAGAGPAHRPAACTPPLLAPKTAPDMERIRLNAPTPKAGKTGTGSDRLQSQSRLRAGTRVCFTHVVRPRLPEREQHIVLGANRGAHAPAQFTADRIDRRRTRDSGLGCWQTQKVRAARSYCPRRSGHRA